MDWQRMSMEDELTEDFMHDHRDDLDWTWLCICQIMSEDFIRAHQDLVNWQHIACHQTVSDDFIEGFLDKVDDGGTSVWTSYYLKKEAEKLMKEAGI